MLTTGTQSEPGTEVWYQEGVAAKWQLEADKLGVFETGIGQAHKDAQATIVKAGQSAILDYAKAVFAVWNTIIDQLSDKDLEQTFFGLHDYAFDGRTGRVWASEAKESVIVDDLVFHATHGSRHVGMMEALRGLLGSAGTLSV